MGLGAGKVRGKERNEKKKKKEKKKSTISCWRYSLRIPWIRTQNTSCTCPCPALKKSIKYNTSTTSSLYGSRGIEYCELARKKRKSDRLKNVPPLFSQYNLASTPCICAAQNINTRERNEEMKK